MAIKDDRVWAMTGCAMTVLERRQRMMTRCVKRVAIKDDRVWGCGRRGAPENDDDDVASVDDCR